MPYLTRKRLPSATVARVAAVVAACVCLPLAAWPARALAAPSRVAIVASDEAQAPATLRSELMATGDFATVDVIDLGAATPTLGQLLAYDAVLVYTFIPPADATAAGNVLADYLDAGGGVVVADIDSLDTGGAGLAGRYLTDDALMTPADVLDPVLTPTNVTGLGTILEPGSPLLAGVTTFACGSAAAFCPRFATAVQHGGVVVAEWLDGNPLIVRGTTASGHPIVELNLYPIPDDAMAGGVTVGSWDHTSDGATLIADALIAVENPLHGAPNPLDLGDQLAGTTSAAKTVTFTNDGAAAVTITAVTVDGPAGAELTATAEVPLPATIAPMGTLLVDVTIHPTQVGARTGSVHALVTGHGNATVALLGNGTGPILTVTPSPLDLGSVATGGTLTGTLSLRNTGVAPLTVSGMLVTADPGSFTATPPTPPPFTIAPGDHVDVAIGFSSTTVGLHAGALAIASTTPFVLPVTAMLAAQTGPPAVAVTVGSAPVADQAFETTHAGGTSAPRTVTVTNHGFSPLSLSAVTVGGADAGDFVVTGLPALPAAIAPAHSQSFTLTFAPAAVGSKAATVTIASDDPTTPTVAFGATGTAVAFSETVTPSTLAFGDVSVGSTVTRAVAVANASGAPLRVTTLALTGATAFTLASTSTAPQTVNPMGMVTIAVDYHPTASGAATGTLTIGLDDPAMSSVTIAITGNGVQGALAILPTKIDFGQIVLTTTSAPATVTITNTGTGPFSIDQLQITGTGADQFVMTGAPSLPATVAMGSQATLQIACAPTTKGAKTATLGATTSDALSAGVKLDCEGIDSFLTAMPPSLDFGVLPVGQTSGSMPVTVTNSGTVDEMITGFQVGAGFTLDGAAQPVTLHVGDEISFHVTFAPRVGGLAMSAVTVQTMGATGVQVGKVIPLRGTGATPDVTVTPDRLEWPQLFVGDHGETFTVTVQNTSLVPQHLSVMPPADTFVVDTTGMKADLGLDDKTTFRVTYLPAHAGHAEGVLTLVAAGATTPAAVIHLSGDAIATGGGCGVAPAGRGGAAGTGLAATLLALATAVARRRRRAARGTGFLERRGDSRA